MDEFFPRSLRFNPYISFISRPLLQKIPFLLPHDKTYHGFSHLVNPGDGLFLDVGANDGISAMGFYKIHRAYRIFSIEPNFYHETALKKVKNRIKNFDYKIIGAGSVRGQKILYMPFYKDVPIYPAASFDLDHVKQAMIDQFGDDLISHVTYAQKPVEIVRLDDLGLKPDIIKIDTEGFEYQVLLGLENTLKTQRPYVVFEFNPRFISGETGFLQSLGYRFFVYDIPSDRFKIFNPDQAQEWVGLGQFFFNVFCIPEEKAANLPLKTEAIA